MRHAITLGSLLAALTLSAPAALAEGTQTGKFCLKGPGTAQDCKYDTMAACEQAKKSDQQCAANTSTTGAGTQNNMSKPAGSNK
jgi:hypothetical protein